MDNSGITEETARQIFKFMVSADRYDPPDVPGILWVTPDPRLAHPIPLKKIAEKDIYTVNSYIPLVLLSSLKSYPLDIDSLTFLKLNATALELGVILDISASEVLN